MIIINFKNDLIENLLEIERRTSDNGQTMPLFRFIEKALYDYVDLTFEELYLEALN